MKAFNRVLLLGGSGFVGKNLAVVLANRGFQVTFPCRRPLRVNALKVIPSINIVEANILDTKQLNDLCSGHDVVINLLGILNESRTNSFRRIHVDFVKTVVQTCQNNKIKRLIHMSALGANQASGSSLYLRSKGEGENLLHTFGRKDLLVTSFQPSVIFGEDDSFINRFAGILKLSVGVFPLACPSSRFAPVYIGDVVHRIADSINDPTTFSGRYPLCGPETWTLKQILQTIKLSLGLKCKIVGLSDSLSRLQAVVLQNLPGKLFTMDNYRSLQTPSTCNGDHPACNTSLSHYIKGLSSQYSTRPFYDLYRQNLKRE